MAVTVRRATTKDAAAFARMMGGEAIGSSGMHPAGAALRRRHAMMIGISVAREAQGGESAVR